MFLVLRHPGYGWRAAMTLLFVVQSSLTVAGLGTRSPLWLRRVVLLGAAAIIIIGAQAFATNLFGAHFEGYVAVIALALVVQGLVTLWVFGDSLARRTPTRATAP